jgi:hypothetical protein
MLRTHAHSLSDLQNIRHSRTANAITDFFVDDDMDHDTLFSFTFQDPVKSVFRVLGRRATQV